MTRLSTISNPYKFLHVCNGLLSHKPDTPNQQAYSTPVPHPTPARTCPQLATLNRTSPMLTIHLLAVHGLSSPGLPSMSVSNGHIFLDCASPSYDHTLAYPRSPSTTIDHVAPPPSHPTSQGHLHAPRSARTTLPPYHLSPPVPPANLLFTRMGSCVPHPLLTLHTVLRVGYQSCRSSISITATGADDEPSCAPVPFKRTPPDPAPPIHYNFLEMNASPTINCTRTYSPRAMLYTHI